MSWEIYNYR